MRKQTWTDRQIALIAVDNATSIIESSEGKPSRYIEKGTINKTDIFYSERTFETPKKESDNIKPLIRI